jgi:hypothetical protein
LSDENTNVVAEIGLMQSSEARLTAPSFVAVPVPEIAPVRKQVLVGGPSVSLNPIFAVKGVIDVANEAAEYIAAITVMQ